MKLEIPTAKPQLPSRRKASSLVPLVAFVILLTIPIYYISIRDTSKTVYESLQESFKPENFDFDQNCNFRFGDCKYGEDWIQDPERNKFLFTPEEEAVVELRETPRIAEVKDDTIKQPEKLELDPSIHEMIQELEKTQLDASGAEKKLHKNDPQIVQQNMKKVVRTFRGNNDGRLQFVRSRLIDQTKCDIFTGEWAPSKKGPYYTNETCYEIEEDQNCMKLGRPDNEFLKWRWKPDDCDLPVFKPKKFLELMKGKSIAFVGDTAAKNHMQSLICLLSKVAYPEDRSQQFSQNRRYEYPKYKFNVSLLWSPYLVRTEPPVINDGSYLVKLYLDEPDHDWTAQIASYNYVVISTGHWFLRPTYFYVKNQPVGCLHCPDQSLRHLHPFFSYRRAYRTALRALIEAPAYGGVTFLRTFAPSHYGGKAGECTQTKPTKRDETRMEVYTGEMYMVELEELRIAQKAGWRKKKKFVLFDATEVMQLRPDGHPGKHNGGGWMGNKRSENDCVNWCLPGPIDSWNDFLQELLRREVSG